jgi:hypothetical protein
MDAVGLLDEHENSNKENRRNREPGCIYTIEYWMWLNTIEYANSESSSLFFYNPCVERKLCIVNWGYTIVTEQQWLDWMNSFRSTLLKKSWSARQRYSHLQQRKSWLTTATRKRPEVNEPRKWTRNEGSNGSHKRGDYRGNINDKNSLQGNIVELGSNVYQYMELETKVIGSPER